MHWRRTCPWVVSGTAPGPGAEPAAELPRIAGSGDTLGVVWQQIGNGQSEILFSWSVTGPCGPGRSDTVNVDLPGSQRTPDIAYANGSFHIVWGESRDRGCGIESHYPKCRIREQVEARCCPRSSWPNPVTDVLHVEEGHGFKHRSRICKEGWSRTSRVLRYHRRDHVTPGNYLRQLVGEAGKRSFTFVKR
ncbi:MAG: hypothetical protein IPN85_05080 [Flavobacteriales bacterium]|nr:hypothetical protein [Flavobacteriales bacterium]